MVVIISSEDVFQAAQISPENTSPALHEKTRPFPEEVAGQTDNDFRIFSPD
jgi:hypothetical protein